MGALTTQIDSKGDRTMCFSDPGKVASIADSTARVITRDCVRDASLRLMEAADEPVAVGDWVLVSLGLVVSVIDETDATILFNELTALRGDVDR